MIGFKTGGDWSDITGLSRNEVVFQGRHKEYGAYYIRRRYASALLFSLLCVVTLITLSFSTPLLINHLWHREIGLSKPDKTLPLINWVPTVYISPPAHKTETTKIKTTASKTTHTEHAQPLITRMEQPDIKENNPEAAPPAEPGPKTGNTSPDGAGNSEHNVPAPPEPKNPSVVLWAPVMPKFGGGDLQKWLTEHISYPEDAFRKGISGTVHASFIIEGDGSVSHICIVHGVANGSGLDSETVRVLRTMPHWTPGLQNGHPVRVQFTIPVDYKVQ
jgi:protein TonB